MEIQTDTRAPKKKFSRGNITDRITPSVITLEITDGITDGQLVGKDGMACNFCCNSLCNTDGYYPSVMLSVYNHQRIISVGDVVGKYGMDGNCSATLC